MRDLTVPELLVSLVFWGGLLIIALRLALRDADASDAMDQQDRQEQG